MITYPLNDIEYNAEDAELYNCTRKSGVFSADDFRCSVTSTDNIVTVSAGKGWMQNSTFAGKVVAEKIQTQVELELPDSSLNRIDVVAIRFDKSKNKSEIVVKKGAASSQPVIPARNTSESIYELYLCSVLRKVGAVNISASDVTDLRLNSEYCGLMADAITEIDTAAISAQVDSLVKDLQKEIDGVAAGTEMMLKATYDKNNNGIVDDAEKLGGKLPSELSVNMDTLWENASLGNGMDAQNIPIKKDLKQYKFFLIGMKRGFNSEVYNVSVVLPSLDDMELQFSTRGFTMWRNVRINTYDNTFEVRDGQYAATYGTSIPTTDRFVCEPYGLYGIK